MNRTTVRQLAATAALATVVTALGACATRAPSDSIVLYYEAGAGENREWAECIEPGQAGSYPVDDEVFELPTSLRTWNIRPQGGDSDQPIKSGSKPAFALGADGKPTGVLQPGPEVNVWATAEFYLNTDCRAGRDSPVVKFWEQTGRRYGISGNGEDAFNVDAFRTMLVNTLLPAEEKMIREQTRSYLADDLDANNNNVWQAVERQLGPAFNAELRAKVGGDYFCGPGYQRGADVEWTEYVSDGADVQGVPKFREERKRGTCPPVRIAITDVGFADPGTAAARARVFEAEQNAKADLTRARAELEKSQLLGQAASNEAYVRYLEVQAQLEATQACRVNPNCTIIIDGGAGGTGVNVNGDR